MSATVPLVAIRCIAYNQEAYIRDTLDGFVKQKTTFPFVAIVHDDASTDNTASIIQEYAEKYPDIIKPIFETENQYSKPNNPLGEIMREAIKSTGAKYVAWCEGDDFWSYPEKLQKQVDFLNSHPDYSMCFHSSDVLNMNVDAIPQSCAKVENRDYSASEILTTWIIPTNSVVMRTEVLINRPWHKDFFVGDNVTWATCLSMGKIRGFSDLWSVYRRHSSGWTHKNLQNKNLKIISLEKWIKHYEAMKESFPKINPIIFDKMILSYRSALAIQSLISDKKNLFSIVSSSYYKYGFTFFKYLFKTGLSSTKRHLKNLISHQQGISG